MFLVIDCGVVPHVVVLVCHDESEAHDVRERYVSTHSRDEDSVIVTRVKPLTRPAAKPV